MEKPKSTQKKLAAGAAATVTAASLLVHTAVTDPGALLQTPDPTTPEAKHIRTVDGTPHRSYILETDQYEPFTWREQATLWMQKLPWAVRALVLLPLWGIGETLTVLVSAFFASPLGRALVHFLLAAAVLAGLFALVWKLLFPNVPLSKIFNKKTLPWLIGAAALLTAADFLLGRVWDEWHIVRIVIMAVLGFGVIALLWYRICQKLPGPTRRKKKVELYVA